MPKTHERCATLFSGRPRSLRAGHGRAPRARRSLQSLQVLFLFAALLASTWPTRARAAARRIALVREGPGLTRSVELALYPWDVTVLEISDAAPDATSADAAASADVIARRHAADAIAWIAHEQGGATLWFYDATTRALHSHPLPSLPPDDAAGLAAVALTLKTLVRTTPWEARLPTVPREPPGSRWETELSAEALARVPLSGASAEPRFGLWVHEWFGTSRWMWGAALGASAGLGMTADDGHGGRATLQDEDLRGALAARVRIAPRLSLEPRVGMSAHIERAEVSEASPAATSTDTRVNPSIDVGLILGWAVARGLVWSLGVELLDSLRYQRWLLGTEVVFGPSPLWIQAGTSLGWSFP